MGLGHGKEKNDFVFDVHQMNRKSDLLVDAYLWHRHGEIPFAIYGIEGVCVCVCVRSIYVSCAQYSGHFQRRSLLGLG